MGEVTGSNAEEARRSTVATIDPFTGAPNDPHLDARTEQSRLVGVTGDAVRRGTTTSAAGAGRGSPYWSLPPGPAVGGGVHCGGGHCGAGHPDGVVAPGAGPALGGWAAPT
ncbi:MAG: hypothetical protein ACRDYB_10210, partial [Acidimicrobiales bacterium]